ncbi:MAG: NADPH-dependent FMN reductase [Salinarchaeum sp.]
MRTALKQAFDESEQAGGSTERFDLRSFELPVYHDSYASPLKTVLDYCGFEETTVGLLAVAGGGFPGAALKHLRSVCRTLNAWVLPHQIAILNVRSVVEAGIIADDNLAERTRELGQQAVQYVDINPDSVAREKRPTADPNS